MGTTVLLAEVSPLADLCFFKTAFRLMPEDRQAKIQRCRFEKDQRLSLGAGLLFRQACITRGIAPETPLCFNEQGKPAIRSLPPWHFNLSHSGSMAMCAYGDAPVGCDIQRIEPKHIRLAQRFFSPSEQALIKAVAEPREAETLFFRLWALKESFIKATGVGLGFGLDHFSIGFREADPIIEAIEPSGKNETAGEAVLPEAYHLWELPVPGGYAGALCVHTEEEEEIEIRQVDLKDLIE